MKNSYKFKGIDWTELSECWKLDKNKTTDNELLKITKEYISKHTYYTNNNENICKDIRKFLKKLSENKETYDWPIWKALLKIKNDTYGNEILLQYTELLLEYMWN